MRSTTLLCIIPQYLLFFVSENGVYSVAILTNSWTGWIVLITRQVRVQLSIHLPPARVDTDFRLVPNGIELCLLWLATITYKRERVGEVSAGKLSPTNGKKFGKRKANWFSQTEGSRFVTVFWAHCLWWMYRYDWEILSSSLTNFKAKKFLLLVLHRVNLLWWGFRILARVMAHAISPPVFP